MLECLDCPFCASSNVWSMNRYNMNQYSQSEARFIKCDSCGAEGPEGKDESEAWQRWASRRTKEEYDAGVRFPWEVDNSTPGELLEALREVYGNPPENLLTPKKP